MRRLRRTANLRFTVPISVTDNMQLDSLLLEEKVAFGIMQTYLHDAERRMRCSRIALKDDNKRNG